mgnify:FL=1
MLMKQRNIFRVFCVIFGFVTVMSLLIQFVIKPGPPADITRSYDYTASEETAYPEDIPETIEENGNVYSLVDFNESAPEITVNDVEKRYTQTVNLTDLASEQAPETKEFDVEGKTVTLSLVSADYTPVTKHYEATGEVRYDNQYSKPNAPEHSEVTYENEAGNVITVEGTLQSVERVDDGNSVRKITSTIELPAGATIFVVNGKYVAYNPETPLWDGYQQDVLVGAQLDPDVYTVTGGYWSSDPYYEGSTMKRDITWTLQAPSSTYVATYVASGETTLYNAVATYSGNIEDLGLDEVMANDNEYNLTANVVYHLSEIVSGGPIVKMMASNQLIMPVISVISGILFLVFLFALVFIARTKQSDWVHSTEAYGDEDTENDGYTGGYQQNSYDNSDDDDFDTLV